MEVDNLSRGSNNSRMSCSPTLRNNALDVFPRSSTREDDEEALKYAALEKLSTYDRLKKDMLTTRRGQANETEGCNLGWQDRTDVQDRFVEVADEHSEEFLSKLKNRFHTVGIKLPTIEVRFEHLDVEAQACAASRALPSCFNFVFSLLEGVLNHLHILPSRKKHVPILKDISGIIKPSRMALLLGPPTSGKTTLLTALAGRLDPNLKSSGSVTYNGYQMNEFVPQRTAAYISQHDLHLGQMTVRETLAFSAKCQGVGFWHEMVEELLRREKAGNIRHDPLLEALGKTGTTDGGKGNVITDCVLKVLGLEVCADTKVGNELFRGISGGQMKRLTTGEMLVGPARALFMDEISNGVDSSTTFQIVNSLKQYIRILNGTAVISLLQPAPETYDLFDDVFLLSDGHIVYQGPREDALDFFEYMGFKCPKRKDVADFLQEVTSRKDQKQYWASIDQPYSFVTAKEFAEAFHSFHVGQKVGGELSTPFDKAKSHPSALVTKKYSVGKMELLKACFSKEYLLLKRNSFIYVFKLAQLVIMGIVAMTLFLRTEMHQDSIIDAGIYMGALFFTVIMIIFTAMCELSMTVANLPVFYKQRDVLFFPVWAYSLPQWILQIPITFAEVAVWEFMTYYVIGFDPNAGSFSGQFLVLFLFNQAATALFRFIGAAGRDIMVANIFGSFALIALFTLGGFILSRDDINKWWMWGYWISPLMYAQNAIVVNEFLGKHWDNILPSSSEPLGVQILKLRGYFPYAYWYWIGVAALIGFTVLFNICFTIALTVLNPFPKSRAVISEECQGNDPGHGNRGRIQLLHSGSSRKINTEEFMINSLKLSSGRTEDINERNRKKKGMVLPFEPHSISFHEIKYSVDMPKEMKNLGVLEDKLVLLNGVSGVFRPGVLTALMGVSGAGKTTLMDVLAGRKTRGYIDGDIKISGYPKKQETFARIAAYCEQNDIHSPHVTIYESLLYSAWLRLPCQVDSETRKMFIEQTMELVEINPLRQALVGLPGVNGLSAEQRKRLTIAVELVANPSIIFMDEPTTGLDARAAAIIMRTVRNTVDTGRTVVCTIHQPSIDIFEAFDELHLLKQGGEEIYVGPLGHHSSHLIKYFEGIEGVRNIKDGCNPATWMLEVTSSSQEIALGIDFAAVYRNSEMYKRTKEMLKELSTAAAGSEDIFFPTQYSRSFISQFTACLWKQRLSYWRNPKYTAVRFLFTTFTGLMFGSMFWNLCSNMEKLQDLFNAMGLMYASVLFLGVQNKLSIQQVVAVERTVFYKERASGMYAALPYALAQVLTELPYIFVQAIVYSAIVYTMIGFERTAAKFLWYLFFMYFTLLYFTFYGMLAVAVTPNHHVSCMVSTAFFAMWNLFSGFIVPRTRMPVWWRWYYWVCPVSWTLYGLAASQFGGVEKTLETGQTVEEFLREYFGFRLDFLGVVAAVVVGWALLFAFSFAVSIKVFNFQSR